VTNIGSQISAQGSSVQERLSFPLGLISLEISVFTGSSACIGTESFALPFLCLTCSAQVWLLYSLPFFSCGPDALQCWYVNSLQIYEPKAANFDRLRNSSILLHLWLVMVLWVEPSTASLFDMCYDQHVCLLMRFIFAFFMSLLIVSGHKVTALWPMTSPMILASETCYVLFLSSLQWNCRLSILIVGSLSTFSISSSLVQMGWFTGLCTHFVRPFLLSYRSLPICWHLIFSFWVWMRSCPMIFTLLSAPGNGWTFFGTPCWTVSGCTFNEWRVLLCLTLFASCWVWSRGAQRFALFSYIPGRYKTLLLSLVSCWNGS